VRVRLRRKVERSADIHIPAGDTGTVAVVDLEYELVTVRLDTHYPGLDDWDNELAWYERALIAELAQDLEPIDGNAGTADDPALPLYLWLRRSFRGSYSPWGRLVRPRRHQQRV